MAVTEREHLKGEDSTMATTFRGLHFSLKHRLIASISNLLNDFTYTQRHGLVQGMKRKGGLGFLPSFLTKHTDATPELSFMSMLNLKDAVVYDIGAFEGILTLFFSRQAKQVVAYEPIPASYRRLLENVRLNNIGNITVRNLAVSDHEGSITITYDLLMRGSASGDSEASRQILDTSRRRKSVKVDMVSLDVDIPRSGLPAPDFIKIDIEGMELPALQGMQQTLSRHFPTLYLEMHGVTMKDKEKNASKILHFLRQHGYTSILHVESGRMIPGSNSSLAREGHLFCTAGSGRVLRTPPNTPTH